MTSFNDYSVKDKITLTKREFSSLIKLIFDNPESLKTLIQEKKLSNEQSKLILKAVNKLNSKTCACCRRFDSSKLSAGPVEKEFEPILDIAQNNVKQRNY